MNGATAPLRSGRDALLERVTAWRQRLAGDLVRYVKRRADSPTDVEVAQAWAELREHPALSWVPPMWRTSTESEAVFDHHVVSAVDKNLLVEISRGSDQRLRVRLRTGPLRDRTVGDGVDPTTPATSVDPDLTVSAASFEEAVIELRDVVMAVYGEPSESRSRLMPVPRAGRHGHKWAADRRRPMSLGR